CRNPIQGLGFSLLCLIRICRDFFGRDCRRPSGVLLSHRAVRGRDVVCRYHRPPACNWLVDGDSRIRIGSLSLLKARFANGSHHRMHFWSRPHHDGRGASARPTASRRGASTGLRRSYSRKNTIIPLLFDEGNIAALMVSVTCHVSVVVCSTVVDD